MDVKCRPLEGEKAGTVAARARWTGECAEKTHGSQKRRTADTRSAVVDDLGSQGMKLAAEKVDPAQPESTLGYPADGCSQALVVLCPCGQTATPICRGVLFRCRTSCTTNGRYRVGSESRRDFERTFDRPTMHYDGTGHRFRSSLESSSRWKRSGQTADRS